jgi:membrane protease YdiL (CAAX protease family)
MADIQPSIVERVIDPTRYPPEAGEALAVAVVSAPVLILFLWLVWRLVRLQSGPVHGLRPTDAAYLPPFALAALVGPALVAGLAGIHAHESPLAFGLIKLGVVIACIILVVRQPWEGSLPPARWLRWPRGMVWRLPVVWLLTFGVVISAALFSSAILAALGLPVIEQPVLEQARSAEGGAAMAGWYVTAALGAPLAEEFIFRLALVGAVMYGLMRVGLSARWAAVIAGGGSLVLFVLAHGVWMWPVGIIPLAALSLVFIWLYVYTGSLWPPVVLHALHNGLVLTLQFAAFD